MGELLYMDEYRERKARTVPSEVRQRIAEIALDIVLLQSEKERLESLSPDGDPAA